MWQNRWALTEAGNLQPIVIISTGKKNLKDILFYSQKKLPCTKKQTGCFNKAACLLHKLIMLYLVQSAPQLAPSLPTRIVSLLAVILIVPV